MKPLLIVNPAANGGRTRQVWDELRRPIERGLGPFEAVFTERSGHATELAREAAKSYERVIAVGGDGTFSEVATGVVSAGTDASVGLIHQGTGGDFRKSLGIDHRLELYLAAIARKKPRVIDAGLIEYVGRSGQAEQRHFVNIASLGMGGLVDKYVGEGSRLLGGTATYLLASLKALANVAVGRLKCEITLAGESKTVQLQTRILAICNGRFFGSGMEIAPHAELDDGVFDVVSLGGDSRIPLLRAMPAVYKGEHLGHRGVMHLRASSISITMDNRHEADRFLLDVDGEYAGQAPVTIRVLPKALRVLA